LRALEKAVPRGQRSDRKGRNGPPTQMKTFTVGIDERLDRALDELKDSLGKTSRAEVFRLAVTLLKIADEARQEGLRLTIADKQGKVHKEILIPG
jgi:hypothetical protein